MNERRTHEDGPEVECVVSTCAHWAPGDRCTAAVIDVLNEGRGADAPEDTECATFLHNEGVGDLVRATENTNWSGAAGEPFLPGRQFAPGVTCTVSSCRYWGDGNRCVAGDIEIAGRQADHRHMTNCATFEPGAGD